VAVVWDAQAEPEPHTDSYSHCLVVKAQAAISDGQCKKPITTVRRLRSQESRCVRRLNKLLLLFIIIIIIIIIIILLFFYYYY